MLRFLATAEKLREVGEGAAARVLPRALEESGGQHRAAA